MNSLIFFCSLFSSQGVGRSVMFMLVFGAVYAACVLLYEYRAMLASKLRALRGRGPADVPTVQKEGRAGEGDGQMIRRIEVESLTSRYFPQMIRRIEVESLSCRYDIFNDSCIHVSLCPT